MENLATKDGDDTFSEVRNSTQNIKCEIKTEAEEYAEVDSEHGSNKHLEQENPVQSDAKWQTPFLTKWLLDYDTKIENDDTYVQENEENNMIEAHETYETNNPEEYCMKTANNIAGKKFTQEINSSTDFEPNNTKKNSCIEDGIKFNTVNVLLTNDLDNSKEKQNNYTNIREPMSGNHNSTKQKHIPRKDKHLMQYMSSKKIEQKFDRTEVRHANEKPYKCEFCSKSFGQKRYLTDHTRIHTNEKPYKCDFCSKSFVQKSTLNGHLQIHTNEKPFACIFCSKSFGKKSNLNEHTRIHTNEKPYKCDICCKSFGKKSNLTDHMRTHTNEKPYKCHFCSKSFGQRSNLSEHIHIHTNEKPHKCNFCSKSFGHRSALTVHTRSHTNVKRVPCNVCNKLYSCDCNKLYSCNDQSHGPVISVPDYC